MAFKREKDSADKIKIEEIRNSINIDSTNQPLDELKKMNLSPETVQKVQQDLEAAAKSKVAEIQGQYYEIYE